MSDGKTGLYFCKESNSKYFHLLFNNLVKSFEVIYFAHLKINRYIFPFEIPKTLPFSDKSTLNAKFILEKFEKNMYYIFQMVDKI